MNYYAYNWYNKRFQQSASLINAMYVICLRKGNLLFLVLLIYSWLHAVTNFYTYISNYRH